MLKTAPPLDVQVTTLSQPANRLVALYRSFGPIIYARCRRALKEDEAASVATREIFVRLLPALDSAQPRTAVALIAHECEAVCRR